MGIRIKDDTNSAKINKIKVLTTSILDMREQTYTPKGPPTTTAGIAASQ
jgi:hypothetical protein